MLDRIRRALHPLLWRVPRLRSLALSAIDLPARALLWPFRSTRPPLDPAAAAAVGREVDSFNRAAETYYASHADVQHLLGKPFSEPEAMPRRLIDLGLLLAGLRLRDGDTILELGAGTSWVSHLLNRLGYRTIAVDVSPTALRLARQVFENDPATNWALDPQFVPYDGHVLPLADASIDRAILYDAYHHLPNPGPVLAELRRVLKPDGIVAMSEPGRGHAHSAPSVAEAAATGVLENELSPEGVSELAAAAGFRATRVLIASHAPAMEVDAAELRAFMGGRGFARYWKQLCAELDGHHYLLLFAGAPEPTTARPKRLSAAIRLRDHRAPLTMTAATPLEVMVVLHNAGDTRWIAAPDREGWTRLGAHLFRDDERRTTIDFDWLRAPLPADVDPGGTIAAAVSLPAIAEPNRYRIVFDLVIEGRAWFADRGSMPLDVGCSVEPG
jgi:SAM-dependent methyltransferase